MSVCAQYRDAAAGELGMAWRMKEQCESCPFATSGAGLHLRKTLRPPRWREILLGLRMQEHFFCHKTTEETGDGSNLICAGSIEWQGKRGLSSQYARVAERLDWIKKRHSGEAQPSAVGD